MRKLSIILLFLFTTLVTTAQNKKADTLRLALSKATAPDTVRLKILLQLSHSYFISKPDSCLLIGQEGYDLAVKLNRLADQAYAINTIAVAYTTLGDYAKGVPLLFKAIRLNEKIDDVPNVVKEYNNIGSAYVSKQDYLKALPYLQTGMKKWNLYSSSHRLKDYAERSTKALLFLNIAEVFLYTQQIDSADHYLQICYPDAKKNGFPELLDNIERDLGEVEIARGNKAAALKDLRDAAAIAGGIEDVEMLSMTYLSTAKLYHKYKQQDSAEYYAQKALETAGSQKYLQDVLNAGLVLYSYYDEVQDLPHAYKYLKIITAAKDSLFSQDKVKQLLSMDFDEKQRQRDIEAAQVQVRNNIRMYALIAGIIVLLVLAIFFWLANRQRRKAYTLLQKQKQETDLQKAKVEQTLGELKAAQTQLIQSEKMASLGELTAGIAHEIQNPLNFVNNFSEVNKEMLEELKAESEKPKAKRDEQLETELINDLIANEEKINHHGKRADSIVKGMLEHSRSSTGQKELTDINAMADEYMRLSYHGLRAKDKSFNSELITRFDPGLPKIEVVPQDMGRILLNLFNNAFYAVNQKKKTAGADYKPEVSVATFAENGQVIVKVKDNGPGISDGIKEKIMQPFFTTKPTGEGTGLGLSLTYDMVVRGHGGSIQVNSVEGEGSEFIISLPIN